MPTRVISTVVVREDSDLTIARRRVMKVTELLGLEQTDQTRTASAVSEVVRSMGPHSSSVRVQLRLDGGWLLLRVDGDGEPSKIPDVSGLVDEVEAHGTTVQLKVQVPAGAQLEAVDVIDRLLETGNLTPVEALRERNQQLKVALDQKARAEATAALALEVANLGIWEIDDTGALRADDRCAQLHGLDQGEDLTREAVFALGGDELEGAVARGGAASFQIEYEVGDRWLATLGRRTQDGRALCAVLDVTERHARTERARARAEFLEQMVGVVSHDLKNPLQVVSMGAQLLQGSNLEDKQKDIVRRINRGVDRASRLVVDLLDFTRDRLGDGIPVRPRKADFAAVVREILSGAELTSPDVRIELSTEGDLTGQLDPDRMSQVTQNLLDNALEYAPAGSTVVVRILGDAEHLTLAVTNQGPTIPEELLPEVFAAMTQAEEQGRSRTRIGLGLYIVRAIARAHGGDAEVTSSAAAGTTFTVRIPRRPGS